MLHLTTERVVFTPHRFDALLRADTYSVELNDIESVGKAPRSLRALFAGGLRERLQITSKDGEPHLFIVNRREWVTEKIREAAGCAG